MRPQRRQLQLLQIAMRVRHLSGPSFRVVVEELETLQWRTHATLSRKVLTAGKLECHAAGRRTTEMASAGHAMGSQRAGNTISV